MVNNISVSLDGPWNGIFEHASIKVNVFIQKNIYHIYHHVPKYMEICLLLDKYFFSSCVFFFNVGNDYSIKDYS